MPATRSLQSVTRKLLFTLHRYVALIAGIFVAILGTTGGIMSFEPEIDRMLHPKLSYVTPQKGSAFSLTEIGNAIHKAFPGERIGGFALSASPNISAQVSLRRGLVYVNPYTGEILGVRAGGMDFLAYVHQLHLRLLIRNRGDSGKTVVSWAGVALLYLLLSGLYLWWPLKRVAVRSGKRFWFDFHNATGVFSFVFLLVLTVTRSDRSASTNFHGPCILQTDPDHPRRSRSWSHPPRLPPKRSRRIGRWRSRGRRSPARSRFSLLCPDRKGRTRSAVDSPRPALWRAQPRGSRSVHRQHPVCGKFASRARGHATGDHQPGHPYGRYFRNHQQNDRVACQPDGRASINQRRGDVVEEAATGPRKWLVAIRVLVDRQTFPHGKCGYNHKPLSRRRFAIRLCFSSN